jgi:hypothetical protein
VKSPLTTAFLALAFSTACEPSPPPLLQVFDLKPKQVENNDTLLVRGAGYPPGETGVLEFEGVVHRTGSEPETRFRFETLAKSESDERVVVQVDPEFVQAFTQTEHGPRHATFRGRATVSFAPGIEGAPPIHGSGNLVLDVYPEGAKETPELENFYGAQLRPGAVGLEVASLLPDGRLARAGAQMGDHIVTMDGLSVLGASDLEPHAGQRIARLGVTAPGALSTETPTLLTVEVEGFKPRPASDFRWALALVVPVALWLLVSQSRFAHALSWFLTLLVRREDRDGNPWVREQSERLPSGFAAFLSVSALFAAIRLNVSPALGDLSLALLYALIAMLELVGAFLSGGRSGRRWSPLRASAAVFRHLPLQLTLALTFLAIVLQRASLGLDSRVTGPTGPWASPSELLACLVIAVLAFGRGEQTSSRDFASDLRRLSSLLLVGTLVGVFFGGALATSTETRAVAWAQLELSIGYVVWLLTQRIIGKTRLGDVAVLTPRVLLPSAALATVLAPIWLAEVWPDWLRDSARLGLVASVVVATVAPLLLGWARRRARQGETFVNPWI